MRILITGCNGFLGDNLARFFLSNGEKVFGVDLAEKPINQKIEYLSVDLIRREMVQQMMERFKPQAIINTVAMVDVEECENDRELAFRVNVSTAENVARAARSAGVKLLQISTDHLFAGDRSFYEEETPPEPVNVYAATKWEAEKKCLSESPTGVIVRTNFYGWSPPGHKPTFAEWLYQSLKDQKPLTLFKDYYFCPIEVTFLAEALAEVLASNFTGIINVVGDQRCSKYEFAEALAQEFGFAFANTETASVKDRPDLIRRPADLSLSVKKFKSLFKAKLPKLKEGLKRFREARHAHT